MLLPRASLLLAVGGGTSWPASGVALSNILGRYQNLSMCPSRAAYSAPLQRTTPASNSRQSSGYCLNMVINAAAIYAARHSFQLRQHHGEREIELRRSLH